ncbi:putative porin [uncultured Pontibacter sp.]|uniref:putative porin n=1 Tax=uncultured Pontibacter sp. TaxID=453356 RepID=UPI00262247A3|nr:putative porin [uncultured Pontibacter sp.]
MKIKLLSGLLLVICLLVSHGAAAQIIDDSTKVLYSPKTTLQLFEKDVLEGRLQRSPIDTSILNMQNERFWFNDTSYFQHLGNVGTSAKPLFFTISDKIGVRFGKNVFDRYAYNPETINYYDTRSPYSHLYYVQGQRGEQVFEGIYARNINERWNAGVAYRILSANKQIGTSTKEGLIDNQAVKLFSHYTSKNKKYDLFFNYTLMKVEQIESGGIRPETEDTPYEELFDYETESIFLQQAATEESRSGLHLTNIFKLAGENLKLYSTTNWRRQANEYSDGSYPTDDAGSPLFYPNFYYTNVRTRDRNTYTELQNQFGFTGNSSISFYKAYLKHRRANVEYSILDFMRNDSLSTEIERGDKATYNQVFVGGQLKLFYENKAELLVDGEFQISTDYRVRAQGALAGFSASQERILRSPSLVEQFMLSNHFRWDNEDFNSSVIDRSEVAYAGKVGDRQHLKLGVHYTNIKRHIFFNEQAVPEQLSGNQRFWGAELKHHINFGPVHFENFVAYTNTEEADRVRIPEWVLDSKVYYQGFIFKKALYGQFGVQAYMPTGYFTDAYMPVTQQFYLQNDIQLTTYPVIDVFVNADIKSLNIFLKMSHVNDQLWEPGYFTTPYYPGMRRSFIFGIKWMFFD